MASADISWLPSVELHRRRHREAGLYPAVSGVWPAHPGPHGQRRTVCHHDLGPALQAFGLVGALGVLPEFIEPGRPDQNGRHERMHRTLKAATTRPAAGSLAAQRRFNDFREEFNHERPHEALDQQTPASCYAPSGREMPATLPALEYPDRFDVRYVSANGGIRWNRRWVNVSTVCIGEYVGLEEIDG